MQFVSKSPNNSSNHTKTKRKDTFNQTLSTIYGTKAIMFRFKNGNAPKFFTKIPFKLQTLGYGYDCKCKHLFVPIKLTTLSFAA